MESGGTGKERDTEGLRLDRVLGFFFFFFFFCPVMKVQSPKRNDCCTLIVFEKICVRIEVEERIRNVKWGVFSVFRHLFDYFKPGFLSW